MTLIEVLVALALLVFGLYGLLDLFMHQTRSLPDTQRRAQTAALARGYLAELQAAGYQILEEKTRALAQPDAPDQAWLYSLPTRSMINSDFSWNAHLRRDDDRELRRIRVTVQVGWAEALGDASHPVSGGGAVHSGAVKEVVGYVVAP